MGRLQIPRDRGAALYTEQTLELGLGQVTEGGQEGFTLAAGWQPGWRQQ